MENTYFKGKIYINKKCKLKMKFLFHLNSEHCNSYDI
jgi:hypothetical protein